MSLYHTHRPQSFADVAGQTTIIQTIINQIKNDKVAHAYLFSGPRGVGKTTTARLIAKAVNCLELKDGYEPCNACNSCTHINNGQIIDIIEIDAASHTGVDNVRQNIIENAQFRPTQSKYKVFIIDEVHMLSTSAFNALLKTLEEPPAQVIFILATTELHKLPETIISRCQRFKYKKVPYDIMKAQIEKVASIEKTKVDESVVDRIITRSDGCMRDAITLLDQLMSSGETHITDDIASLFLPSTNHQQIFALLTELFERKRSASLKALTAIIEEGVELKSLADQMIEIVRQIIILKTDRQAKLYGIDLSESERETLINLGTKLEMPELVQLIDILLKRRNEITLSPIPQLPLEIAVVSWCKDENTAPAPPTPAPEPIAEAPVPTTPPPTPKPAPPKAEKPQAPPEKEQTPAQPERKQTGDITLDTIKTTWPQFLQELEAKTPSLVFILQAAQLESFESSQLTIGVSFPFHADKLNEKQNKDTLESTLNSLTGATISIAISVQGQAENSASSAPTEGENPEKLAELLGGHVV